MWCEACGLPLTVVQLAKYQVVVCHDATLKEVIERSRDRRIAVTHAPAYRTVNLSRESIK